MTIAIPERTGSIAGVAGRFFNAIPHYDKPERWANQKWISASRPIRGYGEGGSMTVEMRFDDGCKNGRESFAITADVTTTISRAKRDSVAGGCMHEEIARVFPELAALIQWHLCATDGPMHYIANTVYHAGNRDHNGLLAGEVRQIRKGKTGELCWKMDGASSRYHDGPTPPTDETVLKWQPWTRTGEGKKRELDHARSCAVWSEATDEQLCAEPAALRAALTARLPQLLADFRAAIEGAGFMWNPPKVAA